MAIAFYSGHDEQYALCDQGTWGTAATDGAAGQGLHMIGWDLKPMVNVVEWNTSKAQRYYSTNDFVVNEKGVLHEVAMPAIPFLKDQGDKFLYACIQNVSEGTATPYLKTFTFPQYQPDFSAGGGDFYTLVNKMPVASVSHKLHDAIIRDLTLSCSPGANDGMLVAESTWLARSQVETSNYAGTITYPDVTVGDDFYFFHDILSFKLTSTAIVLGDDGFKLTITNGAMPLGGASGLPQTYRLPFFKASLTFQALWDDRMRTCMSNMRSGSAMDAEIIWGTVIGADEFLEIVLNGKFSSSRDLTHAEEGEFVTLTMDAYGEYGGVEPLSIYMTNAIDRTW